MSVLHEKTVYLRCCGGTLAWVRIGGGEVCVVFVLSALIYGSFLMFGCEVCEEGGF